MELRGSVVVVTGASSGIGWATARAFAKAGSHVAIAARRQERLDRLAAEVRSLGRQALSVRCDVRDPAQVESLREQVRQAYGRCDVLVNNAGIAGQGLFASESLEAVQAVVETNLMGVLYCTMAFLPMMEAAGRGHVVNIASLAGRFAIPGAAVYSATKHAVVAFSESLHFEVSPRGILVTSVNPGLVATEGFPHRPVGMKALVGVMRPERVGRLVVDVVRTGKAPEISLPRWQASFQAGRLLAPSLYRLALARGARMIDRRDDGTVISRGPEGGRPSFSPPR